MGSGSGIKAQRAGRAEANRAARTSSASSPANRSTTVRAGNESSPANRNPTPASAPAAPASSTGRSGRGIRRAVAVPNTPTEVPVRRIRRRSAGGGSRNRG